MATAEINLETLAMLGITPETFMAAYGFGWALVITPCIVAWCGALAIKVIKMIG